MPKNHFLFSLAAGALFLCTSGLRAENPAADESYVENGQIAAAADLNLNDGASDALYWRGRYIPAYYYDYCDQDPTPVECLVGGPYYSYWYRDGGYRHGRRHYKIHHKVRRDNDRDGRRNRGDKVGRKRGK
jgi:hypothetical protein